MKNRNKEIIRTSIVGIAANVLLMAFKAFVGFLSGSIAIIMDAVNNLSDALSSVITIVGTKLSERPADLKHPYGHGRVEYFFAILISVIVLVAGIGSLIESVKKILHPSEPVYTAVTLVVVVVAIGVKLLLGLYVRSKGRRLKSDSLIASGSDALFDAVITLSTLVSAVVMLVWHVSVDGILGTVISLFIIRSGIGMLSSPVNELLGRRPSQEFIEKLKAEVMTFPGVYGVYDVIVHSYGPETLIGSLHVNVLDTTTAVQIHFLERSIGERLYEKFGIITTVGIYAINTGETDAARMQADIMKRTFAFEGVHSAHAFFVDFPKKRITLDMMPEYGVKNPEALRDMLVASLQKDYAEYTFNVAIDYNYSD